VKLAEQVPDRVVPVAEWLLYGLTRMPNERVGKQPQRLRFGSLGRGKVQAAGLLRERLQQIALALPTPPADDTERGVRAGISGERHEPPPFAFPVEYPIRLGQLHSVHINRSSLQ
jgi:hypothetical protein